MSINPLKGLLAVSSACVPCSLARVYFKMVLKGSQSDLCKLDFSIVRRMVLEPVRELRWMGVGYGPDAGVWRATAVVIKYADNIRKGFATSLSITISFLASVALFYFSITVPFVVGSSIVLAATWLYNQPVRRNLGRSFTRSWAGMKGRARGLASRRCLASGRKSANVPGSPVDPNQPNLGDMNPKRKSPLPTPGSITTAAKGFISRSSSPFI
ncbi:hypothetical protein FRC05_005927 [Tulasnella sp. 425]|nr:hypothetical protein FRC05_005927 [Tulasnella sp. 425]